MKKLILRLRQQRNKSRNEQEVKEILDWFETEFPEIAARVAEEAARVAAEAAEAAAEKVAAEAEKVAAAENIWDTKISVNDLGNAVQKITISAEDVWRGEYHGCVVYPLFSRILLAT
jgi:L-fucose isomerase-like protein